MDEAMADDQKGFWTSIPGILTGLATLIAATTGLIAAFHTHNSGSAGNNSTPAVVTQPATPTGNTPAAGQNSASQNSASPGLAGFWSGSADNLKMAVLNLQGSGSALTGGTFQRPCVGEALFAIDSAVLQGDALTITISQLNKTGKDKHPAPPIVFDLKAQGGKLTGTYLQGKRRETITFTPGKQDCPAGAQGTDSGA
jgi:hypothetical protein